jgi:hypothetical protein
MGFSMFAVAQDFRYDRDDILDGDDFDSIKILAVLQSIEPINKDSWLTNINMSYVGAAADKYQPSAGMVDLAGGIAAMEFLHLLKNAIDCLAMCDSENGSIAVSCRQTHTFWADDVRFAKFYFSTSSDPGTDFMRTIKSALVDTSLNNWGVLRALTGVLSSYYEYIGQAGTPKIIIYLTK